MTLEIVEFDALVRMFVLFLHVLIMVAAGAAIAFGEYALFAHRHIDTALLRKAGFVVSLTLLGLWLTGLALIWIDTRFEWVVLAAKPKLLAKLTVVTLLTLNGIALHLIAFERLCEFKYEVQSSAKIAALLGAISVVTWLYAAFLGLAKPAAAMLGYSGLMALYGICIAIAITVAMLLVRPRLLDRLMSNRHLPPSRENSAGASFLPGSSECAPTPS